MYKTIQKYEELTKESIAEVKEEIKKDSIQKNNKEITPEKLDSIKKKVKKEMDESFIPIPNAAKNAILDELEKDFKDSITLKELNKGIKDGAADGMNFKFGGDTRLDKYAEYLKDRPNANMDRALDSLGYKKNFQNRFLFTRAKTMYAISKDKETREQYFNQLLSYGSVSLFILLPFFTLFLKFYYIRRFYTYIDHLIFVFHSQTVFFMLLSIYFILLIFGVQPNVWLFLGLFALYLFLAMKKFYKQGYIKTFFKFILLNLSFVFISSIGVGLVFFISFMIF